jgi:DNA-binding IscR family transcriptional regulator
LHLAQQDEPMTSEVLAGAMSTNPVVIRRIMAGLRDEGYVRSEKGRGGGWSLACDLSQVTLRDIYDALGEPTLLAVGNRTEAPGCVIEEAVNAALSSAFEDARSLLLDRFDDVTLAMLAEGVRHRRGRRKNGSCPDTNKDPKVVTRP